jgi:hypothetical protein
MWSMMSSTCLAPARPEFLRSAMAFSMMGAFGRGVQWLEFAHGLEVASVCDDLREVFKLFELRWLAHIKM